MIRQRIKAGLKRAIAQGVKLGRPKIDSATERRVRKQLAKGVGILKVARSLGIGTGTVHRISTRFRHCPLSLADLRRKGVILPPPARFTAMADYRAVQNSIARRGRPIQLDYPCQQMCPRTGPRAAAPSVTMSTETLARRAHGNCPNPVTSLLCCTTI